MHKRYAIIFLSTCLCVACDSPGNGGNGGNGNGGNGGNGANGGNGGNDNPVYTPPAGQRPANAEDHHTSYSCGSSSDCQYWFCQCTNGSIVNSSFCDNGACLDASASCTDGCAAFGTTWTGSAGGGPGTIPTPDEPDGNDGGSCGGFGSRNAACDACTKAECCSEGSACGDNLECLQLWDCIVPCNGDGDCLDTCFTDYPGGSPDFDNLLGCSASWCADECGW